MKNRKKIHKQDIIVLLLAAILQLYTSHRMTKELEKENPESKKR